MGLDLTYNSGDSTFTCRFSHADWETIEALRAYLPSEVEVCFDVKEFGEPVPIKSAALKESALALDRFLADNKHLLPATYQFKLERYPISGIPGERFETGFRSGLRVPNDPGHWYGIQAGLNRLVLTKMAIGPDGKGVIVEERDLRNEKELVTEDAGRIQFRRRAAKTTLRRTLREIAAFADKVSSDDVTKIVG
jgi:hypothetical protein